MVKNKVIFLIFLFAGMSFFSSPMFANLYVWTDENGVKHFSNSPPDGENIPEVTTHKEVKSATVPEISAPRADVTKTVENTETEEKQVEKKREARKKRKKPNFSGDVVMFATKRCGYCKKAKAFFKEYAVDYKEYDLDESDEGRRKFKTLKGRGVPLIMVGKQRINGYNEPALRNALGLD